MENTVGKKYEKPPVIEAVCEFRFTSETKWDVTIPGLMYEKVSANYPNKEQRIIQEVEISKTASREIQHKIHTRERIHFLAEDRKSFIQVSPHLLAINRLKPYPTWTEFKPKIDDAFHKLTGIIDVKGLQRIGLRYINRIEIPGVPTELDNYFDFRPFLGRNLPQNMTGFILECELPFNSQQDLCRVRLTNAVAEKSDRNAYILDLDYFVTQSKAVSVDDALQWVEEAHQQVEEIFEGCINDRLRGIFKEVH
jgi:uncharacterized protein (TIGR04255 family)